MQQEKKNDRIWALLSYLSVLLFIPLLKKEKSAFTAYHVNQGLVLFVVEFCVGVVLAVVSLVLKFAAPVVYAAVSIVFIICALFFCCVMLWGLFMSFAGRRRKFRFLERLSFIILKGQADRRQTGTIQCYRRKMLHKMKIRRAFQTACRFLTKSNI